MNKMYFKNIAFTFGALVGITSFTAGAQTLVEGIYDNDNLYTYDNYTFVHDLSNVKSTNQNTGQVYEDAITTIWPMLNHDYLNGDLTIDGRNYYLYEPPQNSIGTQETYPMSFSIQPSAYLSVDYTINNLDFYDVIQLLYMQPFNITINGSYGGFLIAPIESDSGQAVPQEDIQLFPAGGVYAPQNGQLVPHPTRNDVYYYVADPGFNGVDTILMFSKNREGKMGYRFYNVYVSNN